MFLSDVEKAAIIKYDLDEFEVKAVKGLKLHLALKTDQILRLVKNIKKLEFFVFDNTVTTNVYINICKWYCWNSNFLKNLEANNDIKGIAVEGLEIAVDYFLFDDVMIYKHQIFEEIF